MSIPNEQSALPVRTNYTPEEIAKLNNVLEAVNGDRADAMRVLDWPPHRVNNMISNVPALFAKWRRTNELMHGEVATTPEAAIERTPPKELALTPSEKMAAALVVQEKYLKRSLAKLGFKSHEVEALSAVEEFAGQHFKETLSVMHGGMLKGAMRLMMLADRIERDYLQDENLDEKEKRWWWDTYFRILESLRSMNDQANKAALTKAMIEIKEKESRTGMTISGKPGFTPLTSAVQVNVTGADKVTVNQPSNGPLKSS